MSAEHAMKVVFNSYFSTRHYLHLPDDIMGISGFEKRFKDFLKNSVVCGESMRDVKNEGSLICTDDRDHQGLHWGGIAVDQSINQIAGWGATR